MVQDEAKCFVFAVIPKLESYVYNAYFNGFMEWYYCLYNYIVDSG